MWSADWLQHVREASKHEVAELEAVCPVAGSQYPFQVEIQPVRLRVFERIVRFAEAREDASAVDLERSVLAGESELDRVPVEAGAAVEGATIERLQAEAAERPHEIGNVGLGGAGHGADEAVEGGRPARKKR